MIKEGLQKFAYETFRPRTREDYDELFTRGRDEQTPAPYPWFYARVLLASFLIFSFSAIGYSMSRLGFPAVMYAGGIMADLTFIVFLAELYPKRDLPLLTPLAALFVGGIVSSGIIYIFYGILSVRAPYASQAWTAFVEETGKAVTVIALLAILKKRNPFFCFIIGAAVGGGYSAFENMWYMYSGGLVAAAGPSNGIFTALIRALGTPFSHAAWSGLFGWSLSGDKPYKKWQPYVIFAFNYAMHFFVNFPLMSAYKGWNGYLISAFTGILTLALMIFVLATCKKQHHVTPVLPNLLHGYAHTVKVNNKSASWGTERLGFTANLLAACALTALGFAMLGPTCVFGGYTNHRTYYYDDVQSALLAAEGGRLFLPDFQRPYVQYDNPDENFYYSVQEGKMVTVIQKQQYGDYFYRFQYGNTKYVLTADSGGNFVTYLTYLPEGAVYGGESGAQDPNRQGLTQAWAAGGDFGQEVPEAAYQLIIPPEELDKWNIEYDGEGRPIFLLLWELQGIELELDGKNYPAQSAYYLSDGGLTEVRYFNVNPLCYGIVAADNGRLGVLIKENVPVRMVQSIVFTSVFAAAFAGCGTGYIILKKKIRRNLYV